MDAQKTKRRTRLVVAPVREIMSTPVVTVLDRVRLCDALTLLVGTGLRHLVAVDEGGRCLGVLVDRDLVSAWAADPTALGRLRVRDLVTGGPAVDEGATVTLAAGIMCTAGVDAVAVVDTDDRPQGIVTGGDLAAWLARR